MVDEMLGEAGIGPRDLGGIVALRGPGSFTGLRIGLATALGLHQALGTPAAALGSLEVLAEAGFERSGEQRCLSLVDALRDHWYVAGFGRNHPRDALSPPRRASLEEISEQVERQKISCLSGFGARELADRIGFSGDTVVPEALAPVAVRLGERLRAWDPALLSQPLYLRRPAVSVPGGGR